MQPEGNWKAWFDAEKQKATSALEKPMPIFIKFLPEIAAVLMLVGAYTVGHIKGNASCEINAEKTIQAALVKGSRNHERIKQSVMSRGDSVLDNDLAQWLQ